MKTWLFTSFFLLFTSFAYAQKIPYLLEVKKETPFFLRPSLKSEKLAEAEVGTLLMFVEKSKRGIWVKLRDADGLEGWMPLDRTDFLEVDAARESLERVTRISQKPENVNNKESFVGEGQKSRDELIEEIQQQQQQARAQQQQPSTLRLSPFARWLSKAEPAARSRLGIRFDYALGPVTLSGANRKGMTSIAVEASLPRPQQNARSEDYSAALRYVGRAPFWGPFVYGPDLGYSVDKVKNEYRHHLSVGLAAGVVRGPFDIHLRGAFDFFAQSQASFDIQIGVSF